MSKDNDEGFDASHCSPSFEDMYRLTGERVEKREDDAIEYEFVRQSAEDALRLLNGCMDSGMRARGFTKWFRSGNATFRLHLQCVERVPEKEDGE
jgi:hypothetical protein